MTNGEKIKEIFPSTDSRRDDKEPTTEACETCGYYGSHHGVLKNDWIYRSIPDEGVDFDKIEKALGFKLFIWQKTFITRGVFRQYGETTAICIKRLLQKDNPIDYRMRIVHAQELFERQEMIRIHDQLQAAGVEVCEILRSERRKHET